MTFSFNWLRARPPRAVFAACALALGLACAGILLPSGAAAEPKATTTEMGSTCAQSGGSSATNGNLFSCCWAGWGCIRCAAESDGTVDPGTCWVDCYTQACSDANARGRLDLPPKGKTPKVIQPGVPILQTPKPPKADPGASTVQ